MGLAACAADEPLTVAFHPWPGYAPLELARSLGWWPEGLIQALPTASATASAEALLAGRAQAAALTLDEALRLHARLPLTVIALCNESLGADVILGRAPWVGERGPRALRIGVETGAVGELMLSAWLAAMALSREAVTVVPVTVDKHQAAWASGAVDAIITYEPVARHIEGLGAHRWFDSSQLPAGTPILDVLVVRSELVRRQRAALTALVATHLAGQRHWRELPLDAAYRLAPWLGLRRSEVAASLRGLMLSDWRANRAWLSGEPPRLANTAASLAGWLQDHGLIERAAARPLAISDRFLPAEEPV
jgi:NitT/TauT family transport system substrate-binding protein